MVAARQEERGPEMEVEVGQRKRCWRQRRRRSVINMTSKGSVNLIDLFSRFCQYFMQERDIEINSQVKLVRVFGLFYVSKI